MFDVTLPIRLNYFTAEKFKQSVRLNWSSSFEINSKEYVVERSSNGMHFVAIGKLAAKGQPSKYEFIDESPLPGNNYYRLKMLDLDEKYEHSKAIRISFEKEILMTLRPNPAQRFIKLTLEAQWQSISIGLYDQQGRQVRALERQLGPNQTLDISLDGLIPGVYLIKVRSGDFVRTEKLIIH